MLKDNAGDIDGDGTPGDRYLDFNGDNSYDPDETVLDEGSNHTSDDFYTLGQSKLMGIPGFGRGEQARPSGVEINALAEVYDYPVVPEPATVVLLAFGSLALLRRRRK